MINNATIAQPNPRLVLTIDPVQSDGGIDFVFRFKRLINSAAMPVTGMAAAQPSCSRRALRWLSQCFGCCAANDETAKCRAYDPYTKLEVDIAFKDLPERQHATDLRDSELAFLHQQGVAEKDIPHWVCFAGENSTDEAGGEAMPSLARVLVYYPE